MRQIYLFLLLFGTSLSLSAQSTAERVYQLLQQKCVSCHSNGSPQSGLDLQGSGANVQQRATKVFNNIISVTPANSAAASRGDKYIYPGRPDRSFLFRKMNHGLDPQLTIHTGEGGAMPGDGASLGKTEIELLRQWILFGAPRSGSPVDVALIERYHTEGGLSAFPEGPPPAPAPHEGFQIKMGPFYLAPGGEVEYFQKYELGLPEEVEVKRMDIKIGTYSHHFILYTFGETNAQSLAPGLRANAYHADVKLGAVVQAPTDLHLPEGTAFRWKQNLVVDLNAHYINYSATQPYQAEVYVNVYTQPRGTAVQEMKTDLLINGNIFIPNNGNQIYHDQTFAVTGGPEVFIWGMMGHTHRYGTSYKVWKRENFQKTDLIYDGSCPRGIPGCPSPWFDYRHIPMRYFRPFLPVKTNLPNGIVHEAGWVNDGPKSVWFGPTSEDEMMVLALMYTTDTTGIMSTDVSSPELAPEAVQLSPNPVQDQLTISWPADWAVRRLSLYDVTGRRVYTEAPVGNGSVVTRRHWPAGLYLYRLESADGRSVSGKVLLE